MSKKTFGFQTQLKVGSKGEERFLEMYPKAKRLDGLRGDFELPDGSRVELKTDTYHPNKTPNFFIERWGNEEKRTPGGPWKAVADGAQYFVYMYIETGAIHWFKSLPLLVVLEGARPALFESRQVHNHGRQEWHALGYLVPRTAMVALECEVPSCLK